MWGVAEVAQVIDFNQSQIKINYLGWPSKFDEWIEFPDNLRLAPLLSQTSDFCSHLQQEESTWSPFRMQRCRILAGIFGCKIEQTQIIMQRFAQDHRGSALNAQRGINAIVYWIKRGIEGNISRETRDLFIQASSLDQI